MNYYLIPVRDESVYFSEDDKSLLDYFNENKKYFDDDIKDKYLVTCGSVFSCKEIKTGVVFIGERKLFLENWNAYLKCIGSKKVSKEVALEYLKQNPNYEEFVFNYLGDAIKKNKNGLIVR